MRSLAARAWSALENWLNDSPVGVIAWLKLAAKGLLVSLLWGVGVSSLIIMALPGEASIASLWGWPEEFSFLLMAALFEEALFRLTPLTLVMIFCRRKSIPWLVGVCAICSFLIFGWAHVPNFEGFMSYGWSITIALSLQGMLGFFWGLLFIKVAKATDVFPVTAVLMTTLIHGTYNFLILNTLALFF